MARYTGPATRISRRLNVDLVGGDASFEEPVFAPDGQRIAFTSRRGKQSQIFVMNVDGKEWRQLTHEGNSSAPDWSPLPPK